MRLLCGIALLFGLLVLLGTAALYAWRARLLRAVPACDVPDGLGLLAAAWAFAMECAASAAVLVLLPLGWCMRRCVADGCPRGPLILVHGWALNRGCLWLLRHRLLRDGWGPVCCFDSRSSNANVERAAQELRTVVEGITARDGRPITCIGHSLGGLVLRYFLRRYPAPHVRRIVTLGTPHGGTEVARVFGHDRGRLFPGSQLLNTLKAGDRVPQQFDVIALYSTFDAMVLPPANAQYPGAFNVQINDVGHNALLFSAKVYRLIAENLAAPLP